MPKNGRMIWQKEANSNIANCINTAKTWALFRPFNVKFFFIKIFILGQNVIDLWYNEYDKYRFSHQGFASGTGHFTQIVWKASKKLGIGVSFDKKRNMWIICGNFDPAGNVIGEFEANVFDKK
jgi:hypothetical protein